MLYLNCFPDLSFEEVNPVEKLQYVYPQNLIYEYVKRAIDYYENGKQMELLCRPVQNRVFPGKFDFSLGPVLFSLQMV